ncbi:phospholipid carrier-dependent glycosyltransferase [Candidatus Roizmanbacteria bacterium]|nr:phospholipid carrier-dependent glycosyltransferase [Candidatus Roizmanbacteria bacterium]
MIKLLARIEKSKTFWVLFVISVLFFILRFPSIIEPDWYGDEGIYQIIGMAINHGFSLYSQIWDNKPPLLYLIYAFFNGDHFAVRTASLFIGIFTTWLFFFFTRTFFKNLKTSIISTTVFAILLATPLIEGNIANAENFMFLPILAAGLLIYKLSLAKTKTQNKPVLFAAGIILGVAFLLKIVALFDFAAFLTFLLILAIPEKNQIKFSQIKSLFTYFYKNLLLFIVGFILPILITCIYFAATNSLNDFITAVFLNNVGYVNYGNKLFIPQGFLILKLILLAIVITFVTLKRKSLSTPALFIFVWLAFSLFNAFFSQRPYTHYVLVVLSSLCLLLGLIINEKVLNTKRNLIIIFLGVVLIILTNFNLYGFYKTLFYYQNAFLFINGKKDLISYQSFFDRETPGDYEIAAFIKTHTKPNDKIFIWGDSPQIYVLSKTLPINKYTAAYHINQNKNSFAVTQKALNTIKPKYVILLSDAPNFSFKLDQYINKFSINRAVIYERNF